MGEEDTMQNCLHLSPRPPRRDVTKLMLNDGKMIRFEAKIDDPKVEDRNRRFVVIYYIADGSVAVWEIKSRNSGQWEGKFSAKTRKKNPVTGVWFQHSDFAVGKLVIISGVNFRLLNADEGTFAYMEENMPDFPVAN